MTPRKLNIMLARFPYGGNGGFSSEEPAVGTWTARTALKCHDDERMSELYVQEFSNTPITMTRNLAVETARAAGMDVLMMIDSDMVPDCELGRDPFAKDWFTSSFDFLYRHYERGPCVIGAPYCGPPPNENVYVFRWENSRSDGNPDHFSLGQYTRFEVAQLTGIEKVAALPTGLIMYDMRCFDLLKGREYFYYEWEGDGPCCHHCGQPTPGPRSAKSSTEDVTNTRDISLAGQAVLGYNPVYCNWDAWAGHQKPQLVRKPVRTTVDQIGMQLKAAMDRRERSDERIIELKPSRNGVPCPASP